MGLRELVVRGVAWNFAERFAANFVSFVVSIVLARLIAPESFGVIAIVLIFINVLDTFATAGFGSALIQKKDADSIDFSSVFYFNIALSVILYIGLFFAAPFIATFYEMPLIDIIIKVIGIRIVFAGVNSVQRAYLSRNMQFKGLFYANFISIIISAVAGISMALLDYGIWALVVQYLTSAILGTVILFFVLDWCPTLEFSFSRLKLLFEFGWKILGSSLLSTVYVELTDLIIGKIYNPASLAFYNRGKKFPQLIVSQINSSIDAVLFPAMSKHQDDLVKLKLDVRYSIRIATFLLFPLVFGMAVVAKNLILLLLTEKWIDSVIFLQISCVSFALIPISIVNIQVIKAVGRSDIYLKLDIIKKVIGVTFLLFFCKQGVIAIAIAEAASNIIGLFVNIYPNSKLLEYTLKELIRDIMPATLLTVLMSICIYFIGLLEMGPLLTLFVQLPIGFVVYLGGSYVTKNRTLKDIVSIVKSFVKK